MLQSHCRPWAITWGKVELHSFRSPRWPPSFPKSCSNNFGVFYGKCCPLYYPHPHSATRPWWVQVYYDTPVEWTELQSKTPSRNVKSSMPKLLWNLRLLPQGCKTWQKRGLHVVGLPQPMQPSQSHYSIASSTNLSMIARTISQWGRADNALVRELLDAMWGLFKWRFSSSKIMQGHNIYLFESEIHSKGQKFLTHGDIQVDGHRFILHGWRPNNSPVSTFHVW